MKNTEPPVDAVKCAVCGKPARLGEPTIAHPETDAFIHGRCYDAELEPKDQAKAEKLHC
jgi:hypothetical protein